MKMKLTLFTILVSVCILVVTSSAQSAYNGRIIVESKTVMAGESFAVRVLLAGSDLGITSFRIPLEISDPNLTCTYIDFGGSLIDDDMEAYSSIDGQNIEISYIPQVINPLPQITADSGLIATLYLTADEETPEMTITIDSINQAVEFEQFGTLFSQWRRVEAADLNAEGALLPDFTAGVIDVHRSTDVAEGDGYTLPGTLCLNQNYPNPFNPTTTVKFSLPEKADVRLEVFNLLGQKITTLISKELPAGRHEVVWDAGGLPSGVYFYRLFADNESITRKMLLLK
jgi:hypothetical protein